MLTFSYQRLNLLLVSVPLLLMSISLFSGQTGGLSKIIAFYGLSPDQWLDNIRIVAASVFALAGLYAISGVFTQISTKLLGYALLLISAVPLFTLAGPAHWIESLGGFPAIGSGQGIIKYFALGVIGITLIRDVAWKDSTNTWLNYFPVALVLLWIGGMKFTLLEAKGIEDLVATSPLMSWMYNIWDVQMTSNIIGVYDLLALALLALGIRFPILFWPGVAMCGAVFVTTQTFLFTFTGSLDGAILTSTGLFIIKDLWFIANLILMAQFRQKS